MGNKVRFVIIFVILTTVGKAQNNKYTPPPPNTALKTHSFASFELQTDSTFIQELDSILFDKECKWSNLDDFKLWRNFHIHFEKKDSLNYYMYIDLWNIPAKNSAGFLKHKDYLYWLVGEVPPNIILGTKSQKRFSYKEYPPYFIDPPLWILIYSSQMKKIKVEEKYCY